MKLAFIKHHVAGLLMLTSLMASSGLGAQTLAQEPLLSKTVAVRPNLTFIMDESGSMDWECIYKKNPQNSFIKTATPLVLYQYGLAYDCLSDSNNNNTDVPVLSSSDYRFASPENNTLMYDPRKLYATGISATGTLNPASTAAWTSLTNGSAVIGVDNRGRNILKAGRAIYLAKSGFNVAAATTAAAFNNAANYDTYWVFTDGTFGFRAAGSASNIVLPQTANPLPTPPDRADCGGATCTFAQELQNIRNWYTYNSTRLKAAKVGVSIAFTGLPDSFRMNYLTLGEAARYAANSGTSKYIRSVKNYANTVNDFRTWLNGQTTADSVGTPLRQALDFVGKDYKRTDNAGPWGNEAAADHISCRRSFAVMTTDGLWNDGGNGAFNNYTMAVANVDSDGNQGPLITHLNGTPTYRYTPHDLSDPRNIGKADLTAGAGYNTTLADVAHYYWSTDLRALANNVSNGKAGSAPFWQNLSTYTVGFGVNGKMNAADLAAAKAGQRKWEQPTANDVSTADDLVHAAHNGGGEYISVNDATTFAGDLRRILLSISGETSSQAGVAASTATLQAGTKKFVPFYTTGEWWGNLSAISLDPKTGGDITPPAWQVTAVDVNGAPTGASTIPTPANRNLWVYVDRAKNAVEFKYLNLTTNGLIGTASNQLTSTFSQDMTDYIRGDRSKEGDGKPFRERKALLGDIVNSRPAFVKNTNDPLSAYANLPGTAGTSYKAYKSTKASRTEGVLFVGANDGMLHGFAENDGREVFAYIPRTLLGALDKLTSKNYSINHQFYVDGPLKESDAYIDAPYLSGVTPGTSVRWTNVLVGTTGAGAKSVFALDVTKPLGMKGQHVLWEINKDSTGFADLGNVVSDIETGVTESGDWIAAVGNGYASASGKASLYLVNLANGTKTAQLTAGSGIANGLGGVRLVRNAKSQVVGAYAGDLLGNLWRFDLTGASSSDWKNGELLFTAKSSANVTQSFTAAPAVFSRNDGLSGYIVVAGTGRLLTADDADLTKAPSTQTQSAYGLWDKSTFGGTVSFSTIADRSVLVASTTSLSTTTTVADFYKVGHVRDIDWKGTDRGWVLDYTILVGQRSIYPIEALSTVVRVDTIAPRASQSSCTIDGTVKGINYLINPYTGICKSNPTIDINRDGLVDDRDGTSCGYSTVADGSNTVLPVTPPTDDPVCVPSATNSCTTECVPSATSLCPVKPPPCSSDGLKFVIGASESTLIRDEECTKPAACDPATDPFQCSIRRDVRQIFLRQ
jgi:type IV pilus assembly protein PilY1